jgi:hypothetical protein
LFNIRVSADFNPQRLAEQPLERRRMTRGGPELELRVPRCVHLQERVVFAVVQFEVRNRLRVTAIQAFGQAEDRRERSNGGTPAPAQLGEAGMPALRRRPDDDNARQAQSFSISSGSNPRRSPF